MKLLYIFICVSPTTYSTNVFLRKLSLKIG